MGFSKVPCTEQSQVLVQLLLYPLGSFSETHLVLLLHLHILASRVNFL